METRLQYRNFQFLKHQLGFTKGVMVERIGMGGGLILLWHEMLDVHLLCFSQAISIHGYQTCYLLATIFSLVSTTIGMSQSDATLGSFFGALVSNVHLHGVLLVTLMNCFIHMKPVALLAALQHNFNLSVSLSLTLN